MSGILKHVLALFVLAAACYAIAVTFASTRLGFIVFFSAGIIAEFAFWILFWRQRRDFHRRRAGTPPIGAA